MGKEKYKLKIGSKFGRLTVLSDSFKVGNILKVKCCCECGVVKFVSKSRLKREEIKSCGCLQKEKVAFLGRNNKLLPHQQAINSKYVSYKKAAIKRNLKWELSLEDFLAITKQRCYYCNDEPSNVEKSKHNNGDFVYSGVDRIDNYKGYVFGNCIPCCSVCNFMKNNHSYIDFIDKCKKVVETTEYKRYMNNRFWELIERE